MINFKPSFDDVLMQPRLGIVKSRSDISLKSTFVKSVVIDVPIISAPMKSLTESDMANAMWDIGGSGILHRFGTVESQIDEWAKSYTAFAAVGIRDDRLERLYDAGCRLFCIDVAHAHHVDVGNFIRNIKNRETMLLIAGNVSTEEGAKFLIDAGVDAIKCGIGGGSRCTTRIVTGFGVPQLSAIMAVATVAHKYGVPVIADGGIRNSGDIVKAIVAGADTVMIGNLLAGTKEAASPGDYYGMASSRMGTDYIEGVDGKVPLSGAVADVIGELANGIRSGISYAGASSIAEIRGDTTLFIPVTYSSLAESRPRL